jgi:iron-sulfur cluster repair protein YtfE (RIC family)
MITMADEPENNLSALPAKQLCELIVEKHHRFEHEHLKSIRVHLEAAVKVDGDKFMQLKKVKEIFEKLKEETDDHLEKERQLLFPLSEGYKGKRKGTPTLKKKNGKMLSQVDVIIDQLVKEHQDIRAHFSALKKLTANFHIEGPLSPTAKLCLLELDELEHDSEKMMELEEKYLFPQLAQIPYFTGSRAAALQSKKTKAVF